MHYIMCNLPKIFKNGGERTTFIYDTITKLLQDITAAAVLFSFLPYLFFVSIKFLNAVCLKAYYGTFGENVGLLALFGVGLAEMLCYVLAVAVVFVVILSLYIIDICYYKGKNKNKVMQISIQYTIGSIMLVLFVIGMSTWNEFCIIVRYIKVREVYLTLIYCTLVIILLGVQIWMTLKNIGNGIMNDKKQNSIKCDRSIVVLTLIYIAFMGFAYRIAFPHIGIDAAEKTNDLKIVAYCAIDSTFNPTVSAKTTRYQAILPSFTGETIIAPAEFEYASKRLTIYLKGKKIIEGYPIIKEDLHFDKLIINR